MQLLVKILSCVYRYPVQSCTININIDINVQKRVQAIASTESQKGTGKQFICLFFSQSFHSSG